MPEPKPITEKEALDFILKKENKPTILNSKLIAEQWDDETRTRAFFSATVSKADLLEGIRQRVTQVVEGKGTTGDARYWIREFLKTNGRNAMIESGFMPEEDSRESNNLRELGSVRRINLIVEQNVRQAHAVGEYAEFKENADIFPYVEYKTASDERVRKSHGALNGKIFRVDDPIMGQITPPLGFNCRCYLRQLDEDELEGRKPSESVPAAFKKDPGYSFDVTKGLAQALPAKDTWQPDIKKAVKKEIKENQEKNKMIIEDEYIEYVQTKNINPLHNVRDTSKLEKIKTSMEKNGYIGRPILTVESANGIMAGTGSHRIAAAELAEIETLPIYKIDQELVEKWSEKTGNTADDIFNGDDYEKLETLKKIKDKNAIKLMKAEITELENNI